MVVFSYKRILVDDDGGNGSSTDEILEVADTYFHLQVCFHFTSFFLLLIPICMEPFF